MASQPLFCVDSETRRQGSNPASQRCNASVASVIRRGQLQASRLGGGLRTSLTSRLDGEPFLLAVLLTILGFPSRCFWGDCPWAAVHTTLAVFEEFAGSPGLPKDLIDTHTLPLLSHSRRRIFQGVEC